MRANKNGHGFARGRAKNKNGRGRSARGREVQERSSGNRRAPRMHKRTAISGAVLAVERDYKDHRALLSVE